MTEENKAPETEPNADIENDPELVELEDIEALLNRETADGKGDDEVPPADFESYATEGVEKETD